MRICKKLYKTNNYELNIVINSMYLFLYVIYCFIALISGYYIYSLFKTKKPYIVSTSTRYKYLHTPSLVFIDGDLWLVKNRWITQRKYGNFYHAYEFSNEWFVNKFLL